ncbi:MAG: hypothetical protein WBQ63_18090, partial [Candidatus Acidiferrales bacterium]
ATRTANAIAPPRSCTSIVESDFNLRLYHPTAFTARGNCGEKSSHPAPFCHTIHARRDYNGNFLEND